MIVQCDPWRTRSPAASVGWRGGCVEQSQQSDFATCIGRKSCERDTRETQFRCNDVQEPFSEDQHHRTKCARNAICHRNPQSALQTPHIRPFFFPRSKTRENFPCVLPCNAVCCALPISHPPTNHMTPCPHRQLLTRVIPSSAPVRLLYLPTSPTSPTTATPRCERFSPTACLSQPTLSCTAHPIASHGVKITGRRSVDPAQCNPSLYLRRSVDFLPLLG